MKRLAVALVAALALVAPAQAASTINAAVPASGAPLQSAPIRQNFQAAASDINNLQGMFPVSNCSSLSTPPAVPTVGQDCFLPAASPPQVFKWTGSAWILVATFDTANGLWTPAFGNVLLAWQQLLNGGLGTSGQCITSNGPSAPPTPINCLSAVALTVNAPLLWNPSTLTLSLQLDTNLTVNGSSQLAFNPIASGSLLANATAGLAEPTTTTLTALFDRALGSTSANILVRGASAWSSVAMSGDVAISNAGATTIQPAVVTYAKFQNVAASSLVGNPTGSLATAQGITLGATLAFSSTTLQTGAGTGDATWSANSFATTVAKINGATLGTTTATGGNILIGSGTQWVTNPVTGAVSLSSSGVTALTSSAFANPPSPGVNLTGANGTATTARRSDTVLVLDQSIAPNWTGQHQWTVARTVTSASGANLDDVVVQAATSTITGTTGITKFNKVSLYQPTFTDASAVTVTDAATLYIDNAPAQAGSVTITNAWAIRVAAGNVKFAGTGNVLGTITSGIWNGTIIDLAHGGTNANLTASVGGVFYSTSTGGAILAGTVTAGQCLLSGSSAAPTWGSCAGGAAVSSVSNSDTTLTISPTTGAVVASLNLAHANNWTAQISATIAVTVASGTSATLDDINIAAATTTVTGTTAITTAKGFNKFSIYRPTFTDASAVAITTAATLYIENCPNVGGSLTIGNCYALNVAAGTANFGGNINLVGTLSLGATSLVASGNTMTFPGSAATLAALNLSGQTITGGALVTTLGLSTGSITVNCGSRPIQSITNNGAYTITAPASDSSCLVFVTNGASAGATTFSGFTVSANTGATLTTTNGNKFSIFIWRANGTAGYNVIAHQ